MGYRLFSNFPERFLDSNGDPLASGTVTFQLAGTSTAAAIYSDNAGTAATNPATLDANGQFSTAIWGDETVSYKITVKDSSGSTIGPVHDNVSVGRGVNASDAQWIVQPHTPTFVNTATFQLATADGDQTAMYHTGRRLKITDASTIYVTILSSDYNVTAAGKTTVKCRPVLDENGDGTVLSTSISALAVSMLTADNSAVPNRRVSVKEFGAVGDGVTDDTSAFQKAIAQHRDVFIPAGQYLITSGLEFSQPGQTLVGEGGGCITTVTELLWGGTTSDTAYMVKCLTSKHSPVIENIYFNGDIKAGICVWFDGQAGSALHMPKIANCRFKGYRSRAVIIGENDAVNTKNGQLMLPIVERCNFQGCTGTTPIGILICAQNAEVTRISHCQFDPTGGDEHSNHIYARAGGIVIEAMTSARANDYAIVAWDHVNIDSWTSEDRLGLQTQAAAIKPGVVVKNASNRSGNAIAGDLVYDIRHTEGGTILDNVMVRIGNIRVAPTTAKLLSTRNVVFYDGTGGYQFDTTRNISGQIHYSDTGVLQMRGSAPYYECTLANGDVVSTLEDGNFHSAALPVYNSSIADAANADVLSSIAIETNSYEEIELMSVQSDTVVKGFYTVLIMRAEGSNIYSAVTEDFETGAATVSVVNNADGTYTVNFANASGVSLKVKVRRIRKARFASSF